ncbi:MAG: glutamate racemase, partial [Oscillospiraceae bacterium]|nr:glutamate racemase [Oscillospiraceae bacterium]
EPYRNVPVDAIVLGCTHYPFLADAIRRVAGSRAEILDGSSGIAHHLQNCLAQRDLLNPSSEKGAVEFRNSLDDDEILSLCKHLLTCSAGADA